MFNDVKYQNVRGNISETMNDLFGLEWDKVRIEEHIDRIMSKIPKEAFKDFEMPEYTEEQFLQCDLRGMFLDGRKIQAIKLIREVTGWPLKTSKQYIDGVWALMKYCWPEQWIDDTFGDGISRLNNGDPTNPHIEDEDATDMVVTAIFTVGDQRKILAEPLQELWDCLTDSEKIAIEEDAELAVKGEFGRTVKKSLIEVIKARLNK